MKLHVLGTAGYHGNGYRETTCLALPEAGIVFDAGTGFFRLRKLLPEFTGNNIDILLSHAHLDHVIGLTQTITTMYGAKDKTLNVHGIAPHLDAVETMFGGALFPLSMERLGLQKQRLLHHNSRGAERLSREDTLIRSCTVPHPGESTAYRVERTDGKSLVYITDTQAQLVRTDFVRDADTLVHECNFPDAYRELAEASGHSVLSEVLKLAEHARVKKLVLMHFNNFPEMEAGEPIENLVGELPTELPCEVILTHDNMVLEV